MREEGDEEVNVIKYRAEICNRVVKNYIVQCRDNVKKRWYPRSEEGLIKIEISDIPYALKNLNFKKAT